MTSRSEKLLELAAQKFKEINTLESESSRDTKLLNNNDFSAQNDYSSPGPSGVTRTVKQMNYGGSDSESDWDFDSDDSVKDKTYQGDSSDESSDENEFSSNALDNETNTDVLSRPSSRADSILNNEQDNDSDKDLSDVWEDIKTSSINFDLHNEQCTLDQDINQQTIRRPIDIFERFITDEIIDVLVQETNRYASQQLTKRHSGKSRIKSWTNTNKNEMRKFLGVAIGMGLTQVPAINLYWSKEPLFHNEFVSSLFTRDRFLLLLRFLHFSDNESADTSNRLYKIDPLITLLLKNYQQALSPGRVLVIDESMVPFRGRLSFRQYIPNKTHRYGVKLYKLCTSSGYTYNLKVYTGKGDTQPELGHAQSIVLKLLEDVNPIEGRILYADNFYSGIPLVKTLLEQKCLYCGTLRSNRKGVPKEITKKNKKGEVIGKEKGKIKIIKWVDKRPVFMITTHPAHDATLVPTGKYNTVILKIKIYKRKFF